MLALVTFLSFSLSALAGVNINTASLVELESLKNIGPVRAQAIIDYRKKNGGFKTVEELNNVPGISDKTMASLKSEISVSGVTKIAAPAAKEAKPAKETKAAKTADVVAPAAKTVAAKPAEVKLVDTAKSDKKAAADEMKAAKQVATDKKAAEDAKKAAKTDVAPVETKTK